MQASSHSRGLTHSALRWGGGGGGGHRDAPRPAAHLHGALDLATGDGGAHLGRVAGVHGHGQRLAGQRRLVDLNAALGGGGGGRWGWGARGGGRWGRWLGLGVGGLG